jgi:hypothetical protein
MKKIVKLKPGEAAIVFRPGSASMVLNDEGIDPNASPTPHVSNAACVTYALQHPLFMQITVNFIADLEQLKSRMESETVH